MTPETRIAINLFWRKESAKARGPIRIRALILAKAFGVAPNTIYYQCLTGEAESYNGSRTRGLNAAYDTNRVIDEIGVEAAWSKYVTPRMIRAVNAEMDAEAKRRAA